MFEPATGPRVFFLPPGVDFCRALADGFLARATGLEPLERARTEIWVNTNRTLFRLSEVFAEHRPLLMPRLATVEALGDRPMAGLKPAAPRLERIFETAMLVRGLIAADPSFAAPTSAFSLAESVTRLFAEMEEEGVTPADLHALEVSDQSGHWQRARGFLDVLAAHVGPGRAQASAEGRQRAVVEAAIAGWKLHKPAHPMLIAGSTGSRGTTLRLMTEVARLPQGAVVLPGLDRDLPPAVWDMLSASDQMQDHPQYRFARFLAGLGLDPLDVPLWHDTQPANDVRNRLVSLALRPPPLTDAWLGEVKGLTGRETALQDITLITAPDQRSEAAAIALALRHAAGQGKSAALVTPDRTLARRVTRALERFGVEVDDTAGEPLGLTPAGRFLRHAALLVATPPDASHLIAALKHPLAARASEDRGRHLNRVRALELRLRAEGHAAPDDEDLVKAAPDDAAWRDWLQALLLLAGRPPAGAADLLERHLVLAEGLHAGPSPLAATLWDRDDGLAAEGVFARLADNVALFGEIDPIEYLALVDFILASSQVRPPPKGAAVRIWGTVDARVMSADLIVLGGLNEGIWPPAPGFDPWLNRTMRRTLGLRQPERETGLSAHDFQQAIAAREVIMSRALRSSDAEMVPSRWLNRLLAVIGEADTKVLVRRGARLIEAALALDQPETRLPPAPRPAPIPTLAARPKRLSVTEIEKLSRDPYAIHARHILRLKPLDPIRQDPDPRERGTVLHKIMERFIAETMSDPARLSREVLVATAEAVILADVPWEAERLIWRHQFAAIVDWLIEVERAFRQSGEPQALEQRAEWLVPGFDFTLVAKADRIDQTPSGARIIDYKSRVPDTDQKELSQQLALEALMVQAGRFPVGAQPVSAAAYVGLNRDRKIDEVEVTAETLAQIEASFRAMLAYYLGPDGAYPSRRFANARFPGDYDHLARHGEWQDSDEPKPEHLS